MVATYLRVTVKSIHHIPQKLNNIIILCMYKYKLNNIFFYKLKNQELILVGLEIGCTDERINMFVKNIFLSYQCF